MSKKETTCSTCVDERRERRIFVLVGAAALGVAVWSGASLVRANAAAETSSAVVASATATPE